MISKEKEGLLKYKYLIWFNKDFAVANQEALFFNSPNVTDTCNLLQYMKDKGFKYKTEIQGVLYFSKQRYNEKD